jgi:TolB protein
MFRRRSVVLGAALALAGALVFGQAGRFGVFDGHLDVGAPKLAGTAMFDAVSQEYTVMAGGVNMWGVRDEFHFVWKRMTGDFILQTRIELVGKGTNAHRKAGLIVRASQDPDSPYADGIVHGDGLTSLQFRRTKGGITEERQAAVKGADLIRLERKGTTFTFSAGKSGDPLVTSEISDVDLGDAVFAGLVLCSHDADVMERAIFRDVRITSGRER